MTAEDELRARIAELEDALFDLADLVPEWGDRRAGELLGDEGMARIRAERAARPRLDRPPAHVNVRSYGQVTQFTNELAYPDFTPLATIGEMMATARERAVLDILAGEEDTP